MSSYRVTCSCGGALTGVRLPRHQVVSCPACREPVFVLPASPWQKDAASEAASVSAPADRDNHRRPRWSWFGAGVILIILGAVFAFLYWPPWRQPNHGDATDRDQGEDWSAVLANGQKLLSIGQFRLAQQQLEISPNDWAQLVPAVRRAWRQTQRQAALLADLSPEPLEEILRQAARVPHDEWLAEFARRYQDKAIVFDAEFQRQPGSGWTTDYHLGDGPDRPRLIFDNLQVLGRLPGGENHRLLLGVRLAAIRLEPPGPQWVIRFQPDSGVLLTDPGAVALLVPALAGSEVEEVLRRQTKWVEATAAP